MAGSLLVYAAFAVGEHTWALAVYAVLALAAMQTAGARRAWPRIVRGRLLGGDDRMRRP